jgi:hypothetical protein
MPIPTQRDDPVALRGLMKMQMYLSLGMGLCFALTAIGIAIVGLANHTPGASNTITAPFALAGLALIISAQFMGSARSAIESLERRLEILENKTNQGSGNVEPGK